MVSIFYVRTFNGMLPESCHKLLKHETEALDHEITHSEGVI